MSEITLSQLVAERGQVAVAKLFNVSPPAIHKAIEAQRHITVTVNPDGSVTGKEIRPFPYQQREAS